MSNTQTNSQKYTGKSRFSRISFARQTSTMLSFAKADRYGKPRKPSTGMGTSEGFAIANNFQGLSESARS